MIESCAGSLSRLLPHAISEGGDRFAFPIRVPHHCPRAAPEGPAHALLAAKGALATGINELPARLGHAERPHRAPDFDSGLFSCDSLPAGRRPSRPAAC